jgi:hypothetical protein
MTTARSTLVSLNIAQVRLHGWPRCVVGGGTMYLSIPGFVLLNLTLVVALLQGLLAPLFGVPRVRWADHVFMDRGRIARLYWLDRLNCQFCAYANGLCTMLNTQLDHLAERRGGANAFQWTVAGAAAVITAPLWILFDLYTIRFLYDGIISRCLRMHRFSRADGRAVLEAGNYAGHLPPTARFVLRAWKNSALALESLLEQIESAWCPLRHFEAREGIVYPRHHKRFFGASTLEELKEARRFLHAHAGTVSERGLATPIA